MHFYVPLLGFLSKISYIRSAIISKSVAPGQQEKWDLCVEVSTFIWHPFLFRGQKYVAPYLNDFI